MQADCVDNDRLFPEARAFVDGHAEGRSSYHWRAVSGLPVVVVSAVCRIACVVAA